MQDVVIMIASKYIASSRTTLRPLSPGSIPSTPPPSPKCKPPSSARQSSTKATRADPKIKIVRPDPSQDYLRIASLRSTLYDDANRPRLPLLVLDLNNTILFRKEKSAKGSRRPVSRPHLAELFEYLHGSGRDKRWETFVYSSARRKNVLAMLEAVNIRRFVSHVFAREDMGLSQSEYEANIETIKDLDLVWKRTGWSAKDTVLLDDEPIKAVSLL